MTTTRAAVMALATDSDGFIEVDELEPRQSELTPAEIPSARTEAWHIEDPIDEFVQLLNSMGRTNDAQMVRMILRSRDDDDFLMRHFISSKWTDDWNSPEDQVYDSP